MSFSQREPDLIELDEQEEEEFYESLDRILSSSCSSTSCSDDDATDHRRRRVLRFPPPASISYDVWISEPSSVEVRRRRLLQQMGLIADPALSRQKSPFRSRSDGDWSFGSPPEALSAPVPRSRSDCSSDLREQSQQDVSRSGDPDLCCTIKNLDNGEEFVVKEDGMLNKLGRQRQLTMEEFEMCVGRSPIVQELMRRQNVETSGNGSGGGSGNSQNGGLRSGGRRKKGGWLKSIKNIAGNVVAGGYYRERRSSDEKDSSSEKGGRRSSSATDDSQDGGGANSVHHGPEMIRVRQYGKSFKELTGLYMTQEIQAHSGSIWSIKFSLDGKYLASAGEDCVINVWQVSEFEKKGELGSEGGGGGVNGFYNHFGTLGSSESPESALALACIEGSHWEKKRRARLSTSRKSVSSDHLVVPDQVFALGEKPVCSFKGHLDDVLDLSWSKSAEVFYPFLVTLRI